jgi:hypothetical protein
MDIEKFIGKSFHHAIRILRVFVLPMLVCIAVPSLNTRGIGPIPQTNMAAAAAVLQTDPPDKRKVPPGRWRKFRGEVKRDSLTNEQRKALAKLQTIGYASGSRPAGASQTINVYHPDKAYRGLNVFTSGHFSGALLMDMEGNILHTWERTCEEIWPELDSSLLESSPDFWRTVHLFENGDILAMFAGIGIFKLDARSNIIWSNQNGAHHDLEVQPNGDIFVLTRTAHLIPRLNNKHPILEDFVAILDPNGNEKKRISLIECFENSTSYRLDHIEWKGDVFHTNKVHVLDGRFAGRFSWAGAGNVLTSIRNTSTFAVVDLDRRAVVHAWRGEDHGFKSQHDPRILENGNMLYFDNQGGPEGRSRVIEVDPGTFEIAWLYDGTDDDPLFSPTMSTADCLPNGNILITESDNGRALEVTRDKEIVWEFYNPYRIHPVGEYIATVPEVVRLPIDFPLDWMGGNESPDG